MNSDLKKKWSGRGLFVLTAMLMQLAGAGGCGSDKPGQGPQTEAQAAEHPGNEEAEPGKSGPEAEGAHEHEHEGEGEEEVPLDELRSRMCEHGISQLTCDECRYELGVVKVPRSLIGNLIKTVRVDQARAGATVVPLRCEVQADGLHSVPVTAPLRGRVLKVPGLLGMPVKAGDALAVLYSDDFVEIKNAHLSAHQAQDVAAARLDRLLKVQADLTTLVELFRRPEPPQLDDPELAGLVVGKDLAEIVGSFSDYSTARSRFTRRMKTISDTRTLLGRLDRKDASRDESRLIGGKWKASLLTARAELRLARKLHDRAADLVAKGVSSKQDLEVAERDLEVASAKLNSAVESVRLEVDAAESEVTNELTAARAASQAALDEVTLRFDIDRLEAQQVVERAGVETAMTHRRLVLLGVSEDAVEGILRGDSAHSASLELKAPADGVVLAQAIRVGQTVEANESLFTIADLSQVVRLVLLQPIQIVVFEPVEVQVAQQHE